MVRVWSYIIRFIRKLRLIFAFYIIHVRHLKYLSRRNNVIFVHQKSKLNNLAWMKFVWFHCSGTVFLSCRDQIIEGQSYLFRFTKIKWKINIDSQSCDTHCNQIWNSFIGPWNSLMYHGAVDSIHLRIPVDIFLTFIRYIQKCGCTLEVLTAILVQIRQVNPLFG